MGQMSQPTANAVVFAITETATVTGGTERFAGAIGLFVVEKAVNLATAETTGSFDGSAAR